MPYIPIPEMLWKPDPLVQEARKHFAWKHFHRECGKSYLFFDHIELRGTNYVATAFSLVGDPRRIPEHLADGRAKTPISAIADAYSKCGRTVFEAEPWLNQLTGVSDFEDILG